MLEATALFCRIGFFALIRGGYLAVTTFFVLCGFVLTRSYAATVWNARNTLRYALGRVARVYPVYLLSLVVVAPFILADQRPARPATSPPICLLVQGWLGAHPGQLEHARLVALLRDVLLPIVPAGRALHAPRELAQTWRWPPPSPAV